MMSTRKLVARLVVGLALVWTVYACSVGAVVTEPPRDLVTPEPTGATASDFSVAAPPVGGDVTPVSMTHPTAAAADAFGKCQIGKADEGQPVTLDMVTGMGELPSPSEVLRSAPLTGREPLLDVDGPVWIVQVKGDVYQRGGETWTDPTCLVTRERFGWFATGPVTLPTGEVVQPEEPKVQPDLALPSLLP